MDCWCWVSELSPSEGSASLTDASTKAKVSVVKRSHADKPRRLWLRVTQVLRAQAIRFRRPWRLLLSLLRTAPLPPRFRSRLYAIGAWRPYVIQVPIESLLLGPQNSRSAEEFAKILGNPLWPSTRVVDGPHMELLRAAEESEGSITDAEILSSEYGRVARACIHGTGNFFSAQDDEGILREARSYISRATGADRLTARVRRPAESSPRAAIRARRVSHSDCYQINDGHHRAAVAAWRGGQRLPIRLGWLPVTTPLQDLLDQMSWVKGARELYQPIQSPELKKWRTVRVCADRRDKMQAFLEEIGISSTQGATYLDVASCYGWFVHAMGAAGLDAYGVERDPLAVPLGEAVFGLSADRIHIADAVDFLAKTDMTWNITSCLSLLHHFALGRGTVSAEELLRLLDKRTTDVLFLDTGQSHESWFANSLPDWNPQFIADFVLENSSFTNVTDLGPDVDAVGWYGHSYGRSLFACTRSMSPGVLGSQNPSVTYGD